MKFFILINLFFTALVAIGRTSEEAYQYARVVVEMIALDEWDDDVDETNACVRVLSFPTMDSAFEHSPHASDFGFGWSVDERRSAFNQFIEGIGATNKLLVSENYLVTGSRAINICTEKKYTNVLSSAWNILRNQTAPCRREAISMILNLDRPSVQLNDVVVSVVTNVSEFSVKEREGVFYEHLRRLETVESNDLSVVDNAACGYYRNRAYLDDHLISVDRLLLRSFADRYAQSSNRLELCRTALNASIGSIETARFQQNYFAPITNQLLNAEQPLVQIEIP